MGRRSLEGRLMGLWCKDLPFVEVPQGATPKSVTYVLPYYNNPQFLRRQIGWWLTYSPHLLDQLSFIVVDDGSPTHPAARAIAGLQLPARFRLFRIETDVRWNWLAARNIGAHEAEDGWILLTDIDHVVPASTADRVIYGQHDPLMVYAFSRREHTGHPAFPHSASFLMTRAMFWRIGGYDERFSGLYGSDGYYRRRVASIVPLKVLTDRLVRHEFVGDSSTTRYKRKQPEDAGIKKIAERIQNGSKPLTLSFPYHEVAL
jgi:hypothetical protein